MSGSVEVASGFRDEREPEPSMGFALGNVSSPIELRAWCQRCRVLVERDKARARGKQKNIFICNVCNSRGTQLNTLYGKWPPERFRAKTQDEITEFWQSIRDIRNSRDLKLFVNDRLQITKSDQAGSRDNKDCLPLSVWANRGFDADKVKENIGLHKL